MGGKRFPRLMNMPSAHNKRKLFIILKAENDDGDDEYLIQILVVKEVPLSLSFAYPEQSASLGRAIRLIPDMSSTKNVTFKWFVNGKEDPTQTSDKYVYKPSALGKTNIKVVATKGGKKRRSLHRCEHGKSGATFPGRPTGKFTLLHKGL